MTSDLPDQLRTLIETSAPPVSVTEIMNRPAARPAAPPPPWRPLAIATAGAAALACAGAVTAVQLGGSPAPTLTYGPNGTVLTAAVLKEVAQASTGALSPSGRVELRGQFKINGVVSSDVSVVTYSGPDINVARQDRAHGYAANSVQRLVGDKYYMYAPWAPYHGWVDMTGPGQPTRASLSTADPSTLVRTLTPSAKFVSGGHKVVNGIELHQLIATRPGQAPGISMSSGQVPPVATGRPLSGHAEASGQLLPGQHFTALTLWVDSHGVVHELDASLRGSYGHSSTVVTITFSQIGQPQTIKPPAHPMPPKH